MGAHVSGRNLEGRVVVITGASAGVGRAAALEFAARGAHVGLLARDPQGLQETLAQIHLRGGVAHAESVDVADAQAVMDAAAACEQALGPISVWVNNAMATVFSKVDGLSAEEIDRVTRVTYLGSVHGTLAALASMRRQGKGTIIQISSGLAYRAIPLQAAYSAAKHAARGFHEALRCELIADGSAIQLCSVVLPAMNTPQFGWARTHCERTPRPVAPVYEPQAAAHAIVQAALRPEREIFVGYQAPLLVMGQALAPGLMDRYLARNAIEGQCAHKPVDPARQDNLFETVPNGHATRGEFGHEARRNAVQLSAGMTRGVGLAGLLAMGAVIGACLAARR